MESAIDNDLFVSQNLEKLVEKYPRQTIVISAGEIFIGEGAVKKARTKYPKIIPMIMPVPGPEEFSHLL
jgi:Ni,Fe-hydrogenase III small subunit